MREAQQGLGWFAILRLALVQTAIGAMVVLTTATMNRVMVVEHGLAATIPGALVALHYAVQMLRPRFGHGADVGRSRTAWIVGGLALLALGTVLAAFATGWIATHFALGLLSAMLAFLMIGAGVGAAGTNLLALMAAGVAAHRRPQAATLMWTLMIVGFAVTAGLSGRFLDPFSDARLVAVTAVVAASAFALGTLAILGVESQARHSAPKPAKTSKTTAFGPRLASVWREADTRRFAIFVFVSMLAYSAQDLILEPFAGTLFAMTPGETTQLSGVQHGGTVLGMVAVALAGMLFGRRFPGLLRLLCVLGCLGSALAFAALFAASRIGESFPLAGAVGALGLFNGLFAVAAIGSMMGLAGAQSGEDSPRHGIRMGLWGAAQAIAFGLGGFFGTVLVDLTLAFTGSPASAYGAVFLLEAAGFVVSAALAWRCVGNAAPLRAPYRPAPAQSPSLPASGAAA
ncbi:MAG: BCD family MFS transporter [Pseudomonadota bacterium]|nr:BCD family MFS transporter [Pseudomonadota bacterium]